MKEAMSSNKSPEPVDTNNKSVNGTAEAVLETNDTPSDTTLYVINSNGLYNKIINGVVQPTFYRLWNNNYLEVQNNVPSTMPQMEQSQYQRYTGSFRYTYNGDLFNLDTRGWQKAQLNQTCQNKEDLYLFYNSLRLQARQHGILLKPLKDLDSNSSLCPLTADNCDNFVNTRREMTGALYQKLSHEKTFGSKFAYAAQVIDIHSMDHDGYKVLTKLLKKVHPKLDPNCETLKQPIFSECKSLHHFIKKYRTYLVFEQLKTKPREYTNKEQVDYVIEQLDDRFEAGILQVKALQNIYLYKSYPSELLVDEDLVDTILKYIPDEEQHSLNNNIEEDSPIINAFQRKPHNTSYTPRSRKTNVSTSKRATICGICGNNGHNGLVDGCDLMSKHINITKFLSNDRQATPKILKGLMEKFKERTQAKVQRAKQNLKITQLNLDEDTKAKIFKVLDEDMEDVHSDEDNSLHSDEDEE